MFVMYALDEKADRGQQAGANVVGQVRAASFWYLFGLNGRQIRYPEPDQPHVVNIVMLCCIGSISCCYCCIGGGAKGSFRGAEAAF